MKAKFNIRLSLHLCDKEVQMLYTLLTDTGTSSEIEEFRETLSDKLQGWVVLLEQIKHDI